MLKELAQSCTMERGGVKDPPFPDKAPAPPPSAPPRPHLGWMSTSSTSVCMVITCDALAVEAGHLEHLASRTAEHDEEQEAQRVEGAREGRRAQALSSGRRLQSVQGRVELVEARARTGRRRPGKVSACSHV